MQLEPTQEEQEQALQRQQQQGMGMPDYEQRGGLQKKDDEPRTMRLRLDLNLDAQLELRAKVHGDVTLTLLES